MHVKDDIINMFQSIKKFTSNHTMSNTPKNPLNIPDVHVRRTAEF